jgi:hypothetical protein
MQDTPGGAGDRPAGRQQDGARRGPTYGAEDVRQGEIILRTRRRRWIFFGGLVASVILALLLATLAA